MKKILLALLLCIACASCTMTEKINTPFDTGGRVYKLALLPWKTTTMDFDFKYRWRMTQSLLNACKQAGPFDLKWSSYVVNGGNVEGLKNIKKSSLWERRKYGKYYPIVPQVQASLSGTDADLALLYDVSADNGLSNADTSDVALYDSVRLFLVDVKSGEVVVEFTRTDFLLKRAGYDIKSVTLRAFNEWLKNE